MVLRAILLGTLILGLLNVNAAAAPQQRRDRDRNRDTDRTEDEQERGRLQQPQDPRPQLVPPRPGPPDRFDRWVLGVNVRYDDTGALITHVDRDSAAWEAGLERRDQIVAVDGYQIGYVNRQLYSLERELHLRADRRGNVRLLVQNHRNQRLVNIDVRLRRTGRPGDRDRPDRDGPGVISGTVDIRAMGQVSRNSVLVVRLIDTTSRITTIKPLAQASIQNPGPFPVPFQLTFDPGQVNAERKYALHAMLTTGGLMTYRTREGQVVDFADRTKRYQLMLDRR
jgi:hypothetical protein